MMTAKEYVADKCKSYRDIAKFSLEDAEASNDIYTSAKLRSNAGIWKRCAREMDKVRELLEEEQKAAKEETDCWNHTLRLLHEESSRLEDSIDKDLEESSFWKGKNDLLYCHYQTLVDAKSNFADTLEFLLEAIKDDAEDE